MGSAVRLSSTITGFDSPEACDWESLTRLIMDTYDYNAWPYTESTRALFQTHTSQNFGSNLIEPRTGFATLPAANVFVESI